MHDLIVSSRGFRVSGSNESVSNVVYSTVSHPFHLSGNKPHPNHILEERRSELCRKRNQERDSTIVKRKKQKNNP
jgi:hypothetical protein